MCGEGSFANRCKRLCCFALLVCFVFVDFDAQDAWFLFAFISDDDGICQGQGIPHTHGFVVMSDWHLVDAGYDIAGFEVDIFPKRGVAFEFKDTKTMKFVAIHNALHVQAL